MSHQDPNVIDSKETTGARPFSALHARKAVTMSFKNSMVRGLALCGMNSVARAGYADSKMFSDIIAGTDKDAR